MKKTNIVLSFVSDGGIMRPQPKLRIKIDSKGFPYVVIDNEKIIIGRTLPSWDYDNVIMGIKGRFTVLEGLEELKRILSNPDLTVDKLSMKEVVRLSGGY